MTRSWVAFGVGLLVLASPVRQVWARPELGPWSLYVVSAGLIALGYWVAQGRGE